MTDMLAVADGLERQARMVWRGELELPDTWPISRGEFAQRLGLVARQIREVMIANSTETGLEREDVEHARCDV